LTAYTTPQLLGGTDTRVLATMIYQQAMSLGDWNQASVVAVVMIVVTILVSSGINAVSRKLNPTI
jgi:putative spermidine/putrescine transport system permease protein